MLKLSFEIEIEFFKIFVIISLIGRGAGILLAPFLFGFDKYWLLCQRFSFRVVFLERKKIIMSDYYGYLLPLTFIFGSISWRFLLGTLYFPSFEDKWSTKELLKPLVAVHLFRYISLSLLVPGLTTAAKILPESHIYRLVAGDVLCSVLAMFTLLLLYKKDKAGYYAAAVLTVVGLTDLLMATINDMPLFFENIEILDSRLFSVLTTFIPLVFVSHVTIGKMLIDVYRGKRSQ